MLTIFCENGYRFGFREDDLHFLLSELKIDKTNCKNIKLYLKLNLYMYKHEPSIRTKRWKLLFISNPPLWSKCSFLVTSFRRPLAPV